MTDPALGVQPRNGIKPRYGGNKEQMLLLALARRAFLMKCIRAWPSMAWDSPQVTALCLAGADLLIDCVRR